MSPKELRKGRLQLIERGEMYAYQEPIVDGELYFLPIPLLGTDLIPLSLEEVRLIFQGDEEREKADLN